MGADKWSSPSLPRDGSPAMTDLLRYHLVNGSWDPDKLTDGMLLDSELRTSMLKDRRQKIPVSVTVDNHGFKIKGETPTTVGFADANTLGDPVCIGNSVIYMISKVLEPPSDVLQTAMTDLSLSTFVASVYAAGLDKTFKSTPGISIFAPVNDAFSQLGLAMNYLFLPTARSELRKLLRYHAVDGVAYLNELEGARDKRYSTLEGSSVYANAENGTIALRGPNVEGFPASGQIDPSKVTGADLLTSNGVLHVVDQTMLPPTLDITIEKLMRGAKANTMIDLLESANMSWVIRGEAPPEGFFDGNVTSKKKKNKKRRKDKSGQEVELDGKSYTVLCPLDSAFSRFNLTRYLHDQPALVELARQHIIPTQGVLQSRNPFPSDGRPLTIADDTKYDTMLSHRKGGKSTYGTVKFLRFGLDGWMVGIDGARGDARHDSARVVGYGRATPALLPSSNGTDRMLVGGGLITLDAVLEPFHPSWLVSHTPAILITMLVMVVVILISLLGWRLWKSRRDAQYHTVETDDQS